MPDVCSCLTFILDEAICLFINGIICEMHTEVIEVGTLRRKVLLSGESGKTLFVDECSKGVETGY